MNRWPHGDPNAVVRDVLAGSAYRHAPIETARPPQPSISSEIWTWLLDHVLRPLLAPLSQAFAHASAAGLGTLLGAVSIVIALALFVFVAFRLALAFAHVLRRGAQRSGESESLAPARDAAAWRVLARDAAARNDFARAIAALFAAALALLDERAVVAFDPARTPGEYRRAVRRDRAPASAAFDDLADRFLRASYAPERPSALAYAEAHDAFERFEPTMRA